MPRALKEYYKFFSIFFYLRIKKKHHKSKSRLPSISGLKDHAPIEASMTIGC
ncbi:MAG: hypothetical protein ACFE9R_15460 [Candidatus Hermodarchaeota archaeon]